MQEKKVQVLVATMNQKDFSILSKMNIDSDALIGNQCDENSIKKIVFKNHSIIFLNFNERGVGLNRNNALMRSKADYCIFSDDDVVFYDGYATKIAETFQKKPNADVIVFNIDNEEDTVKRPIKRIFRVTRFNYMRYGAVRIAIKTRSIHEKGVFFNLCFGGGTAHSAGEDTIFLHECLSKKIKIYAAPLTLGRLENNRPSTWFVGYNDKYFSDKGSLFRLIHPRLWKLFCLVDAFRHRELYKINPFIAYRRMVNKNGRVEKTSNR